MVLKSSCLCPSTPGPISKVCGPLKLGDERAEYLGMLSVFPIKKNDFQNLMGFYIADQTIFADGTTCPTKKSGDFYSQVGFAISHDGGKTWDRQGPVLANEPLPNRPGDSAGGPIDFNQPTFFKQDWSTPIKFYTVPEESNWIKGKLTQENMVFVTPGLESNHTIGQEGLVIYSTMGRWAEATGGRAFVVAKYCFGP